MKGVPTGSLPSSIWFAATLVAMEPALAQDQTAPPEPQPEAELQTIPVNGARTDAPPPERRKRPPADEGIEEVIVTATKRAENPRELPATVAAISGAEMEKHGYQSQEDFLKLIPGVTFSNDTITANRITIRGIGADLNTSNTTGIFLGDVPFDDPILPRVTLDPNPFDIARVEVLKGPQGTLFGGSALNGAVRYVPQDPKLQTWETKLFVQEEDVHLGGIGNTYGGAQNIPVGDTAAFRIVGFDRDAPGWVDDHERNLKDVNETTQSGGRVMGLWEPGDAWKVAGMAVVQKTFVHDTSITDNRDGDLSRSDTPAASPVHTRYDLETIGLQHSFDGFDVLSQTSRTYKRFNGQIDSSRIGNVVPMPPPSVTIRTDNDSIGFMQELRATSNADFDPDWKWLGGAFYRRIRAHEISEILASDATVPLPPGVLTALDGFIPGLDGTITEDGKLNTTRAESDPIITKETALFGETTYTLWDKLEATLGVRAFLAQSESRILFSGALVANQTIPNGELEHAKEGNIVERGINPKFALKYTFNPNVAVYGSASKGYRFGGPQVLVGTLTSTAPDQYKSDTIWAYEAGVRSQWLDNSLYIDVTPFLIDWKNPQLQQADSTGLGSYFDNVGGSRVTGVEWATRYRTPLRGLVLAFAGSYVDNVTTKPFTTSSGDMTQPGTRWPLAAKWQTATTVNYQRVLFGNWDGGGSLAYTTISSAPNTLAYLDTVFGYNTLEAQLNFGNATLPGAPEISLTLSNATDERGIVSGVNNPQFPLDHNYIRPRTLVVRLSLTF